MVTNRKIVFMMQFIQPSWPAPAHVKASSTTRFGGVSQGIYSGFNLGLHVQDDAELVGLNRQQLVTAAKLPQMPFWLNQTHSTDIVHLIGQQHQPSSIPNADASITKLPEQVCIVMTADCLPVLICDKAGTQVAAIHAGWRGLLDGIIEKTVALFNADPNELLIWLGPAISQRAFQVGSEVRTQFMLHDSDAEQAFIADANDKYFADLYLLAKQRLQQQAITPAQIFGGEYCTFQDNQRFYSYRRDGQTGRQASLIYLDPQNAS